MSDGYISYGSGRAAIDLYDIVHRHGPRAGRRVGRFLSRYSHLLNLIPTDDVESATTLYALIREDAIRAVKASRVFDPFQSHLLNVVVGRHREYGRRLKS